MKAQGKLLVTAIFGFAIIMVQPAQAQQCLVNSTIDCTQGTTSLCSGAICQTWFLNPVTGEWQLTGDPKWKTELRCQFPGAHTYTNATDVPVVADALPGQAGQVNSTSLGTQVCITFYQCSCGYPNAQPGGAARTYPIRSTMLFPKNRSPELVVSASFHNFRIGLAIVAVFLLNEQKSHSASII